jgi:hypothetical protein
VFAREKRPAIVMSVSVMAILVVFAVLACPLANQGVDRESISTVGDGPTFDEGRFYLVQLALSIALHVLIGIVVWRTAQRPSLALVLGALVTAITPFPAWVAQSVLYPSAYYYIYPPVSTGTHYGIPFMIAAAPILVPPAALITWLAAWIPTKLRPLGAARARP